MQLNPNHQTIPYIQRNWAELFVSTGDWAKAKKLFSEATENFKRTEREWLVKLGLIVDPGVILHLQGKLSAAQRVLQDNVITARKIGYQQRVATTLYNLARLFFDIGEKERAVEHLGEALQIAREIDFRFATSLILCQIGHTKFAMSDTVSARRHYAEALQIAKDEEIYRVSVDVLFGVAQLLIEEGDFEQGIALLDFVQHHPASDFEVKKKAEAKRLNIDGQGAPDSSAPKIADPKAELLAWATKIQQEYLA